MCGRFSVILPPPIIVRRYRPVNRDFQFEPNPNIAPTNPAPVVVRREEGNFLQTMRWGLIPRWAKDTSMGVKCFNARAETLGEKAAFKQSLKSQRCVVPVDGFYEWKAPEAGQKKKTPYVFKVEGEEVFSLAGLWANWKNLEGRELVTFTIVTTTPNELLKYYHNRMPVILSEEAEEMWLDPTVKDPIALQALLVPFVAKPMSAYPKDPTSPECPNSLGPAADRPHNGNAPRKVID